MKHKAAYWINALQLEKHPEGGYFKRIQESEHSIEVEKNKYRKTFSSIYYLLENKDFSAFHRLKSDEIWNFYFGGPLTIYIINNKDGSLEEIILGNNLEKCEQLQILVKRDQWFAARPNPSSEFTLVGCTVIPGFEFEDWELAKKDQLLEKYPQHTQLIKELTISYS